MQVQNKIMSTGILFDIKEFAVHDGPGIRTTFFLKGCPLRCTWCHNPEGQKQEIETLHTPMGDRAAGKIYTSEELAVYINSQADRLNSVGGGITFSGGEPLMQADFVLDILGQLSPIHIVLDTCGYADEETFVEVIKRVSLVYYDLKCMDPETHIKYTGKSNELILRNYSVMAEMSIPHVVRIPLIPGITDTDTNLEAAAAFIASQPNRPLRIDLLPLNPLAGAKYDMLFREYTPGFDPDQKPNINKRFFENHGLEVEIQ